MSIEVTLLARLARLGNPVLKAVAMAMADYANADGAGVYPANNTLARDTDLSRRAVVRALADLKRIGVIRIDEQSLGGAHKDTTVRSFDLDVLLSISRGSKRHGIPPGLFHVVSRTLAGDKTFAIAPLDDAPNATSSAASDAVNEDETFDLPVTVGHPCQTVTGDPQSPHGGLTVTPRGTDSHPNHQELPRTTLSPLPPSSEDEAAKGRGGEKIAFAKSWTPAAQAVVAEIRLSVTRRAVAEVFLAAVCGTLGPPRDVDGAAYVRQLAAKLGTLSPQVLAAVAEAMLAARARDLPPAIEIDRVARNIAAKIAPEPAPAATTRVIRNGSPEWSAYMAMIGPDLAREYRSSSSLGVRADALVRALAICGASDAHGSRTLAASAPGADQYPARGADANASFAQRQPAHGGEAVGGSRHADAGRHAPTGQSATSAGGQS